MKKSFSRVCFLYKARMRALNFRGDSVFFALALGLSACTPESEPFELASVLVESNLEESPDFLAIDRKALGMAKTQAELRGASFGSDALSKLVNAKRDFFLAIHRRNLGQRYFLSGFLDSAWPPKSPQSLGTRVVTFLEQNSRLYLLDADDRKIANEDFPSQELIDAFPIVESYKGISVSSLLPDYVLIDPDTALNGLLQIANPLAAEPGQIGVDPVPFEIEMSFTRDYQALDDGASFRKVLTGRTEGETSLFRGSATVSVSLRKYVESPGFQRLPQLDVPRYFSSAPHAVPNHSDLAQSYVTRWNLYPGMKPILLELSPWVKGKHKEAGWASFDAFAAVKRALDSWNTAIGFQALALAWAPQDPAVFGLDDRNYIFLDRGSLSSLSYASFRTNPSTGEIRGASILIAGAWQLAVDGREGQSQAQPADANFLWMNQPILPKCSLDLRKALAKRFEASGPMVNGNPEQITLMRAVEAAITVVVAHEIGHILGIRHNFKGSLAEFPRSVMDYLTDEDIQTVAPVLPLPDDIQSIQFLAGQRSTLPDGPFCTDEDVELDPDCSVFDRGLDAIQSSIDSFRNYALAAALGADGAWTDESLSIFHAASQGLLRYLVSNRPNDARRASEVILSSVGVPMPAELRANPTFAWAADQALIQLLTRMYLHQKLPELVRSTGSGDAVPSLPEIRQLLTHQTRGVLENRDAVRSMASRRRAVSILHAMQSPAGRIALEQAQWSLASELEREHSSPEARTQLEDLELREG